MYLHVHVHVPVAESGMESGGEGRGGREGEGIVRGGNAGEVCGWTRNVRSVPVP